MISGGLAASLFWIPDPNVRCIKAFQGLLPDKCLMNMCSGISYDSSS
jgi:hypothetical protein